MRGSRGFWRGVGWCENVGFWVLGCLLGVGECATFELLMSECLGAYVNKWGY